MRVGIGRDDSDVNEINGYVVKKSGTKAKAKRAIVDGA